MTKRALNSLHVFAPADKKRREAVAEVVESESLTGFEAYAALIAAGQILSFATVEALRRVFHCAPLSVSLAGNAFLIKE